MKRTLLILVPLALIGASAWGFRDHLFGTVEATARPADVYTVARGPLDVTITESAYLRAERSVNLRSDLEGRAAITKVVLEGTSVKEGDELVVLDISELKDREQNQQINVARSEADVSAAEKEVAIQESKNGSDTAKGEDLVTFAHIDLEKFLGKTTQPIDPSPQTGENPSPQTGENPSPRLGEKEQLISKAQGDLDVAEDDSARAKNRLKWTEQLYSKKYVSEEEFSSDRLAARRSANAVLAAKNGLFILKTFTLYRQERDLTQKLAMAEAELGRTKLRCDAELTRIRSGLAARRQQLELEQEKLERYRKQIASARITAPNPGIVVYAPFWDNNGPVVIKEGTEVRQGQPLIILPDLESMIAQCKVRESQLDLVKKDQRVTISIEVLPDQTFTGEVAKIGVLPDNEEGWASPDSKTYTATIGIDGDTTMLRPGQSATVEIHVAHKDDVLAVPVQAVFRKKHVNYVWVLDDDGAEATPVKTGLTNDKFVEIVDGVVDGDEVALARPTGIHEPEFNDLEAAWEKERHAEKQALHPLSNGDPVPAVVPADSSNPRIPEPAAAAPAPAPAPAPELPTPTLAPAPPSPSPPSPRPDNGPKNPSSDAPRGLRAHR